MVIKELPPDKRISLNREMLNPMANVPFWGKVFSWVEAFQLQACLDEAEYTDPFQSGFRPGCGTEIYLVTLVEDICQERDVRVQLCLSF